jgi:alkylhydroperoxidase family enzyme
MSWIEIKHAQEATGELAELYARARDPRSGELDHIMSIHSLHPAGLAAHLALYEAVMGGTPSLRKLERELIALVVSDRNGCDY